MREHTRVLLVEDDEDDYLIIQELLQSAEDLTVSLDWAPEFDGAMDAIAQSNYDVYLVDYRLGARNGMDLIAEAHSRGFTAPFILMTGQADRDLEMAALRGGAEDYLRKKGLGAAMLERSIRHAIERRRIRTELDNLQSHELKMKDDFMSHVSHELRTPIAVVHQFVSILQDGLAGAPTPQQREYLDIILSNVDQLNHMVTELLEVTRAEVGMLKIECQRLSVTALLDEVRQYFEPTASASDLRFTVETSDDTIEVFGDRSRVHQVLGNLIENSVKFTAPGGAVTVRAAHTDDGFVRFDVSDTGIGIAIDRLDDVFERLSQVANVTQASRKGLGLGLYIAKELVVRHGGRFSVTSREGEGSTFSFTLPVWSLAEILLPVAGRAARLDVPVLLFEIRLSGDAPRHNEHDDVRRAAARSVERLAFKDDVVIPVMEGASRPGSLYLATAAEEADGASIARRVSEELLELDAVRAGGLGVEVSFEVVSLGGRYPVSSDADLAQDIACRVEKSVCGSPDPVDQKRHP